MNILEIGSFYGNASAALFFYFKKAKIFGADINPDMFRYTSSRINSFYVNSSLEESLINEILNDEAITLAIKNYKPSKKESYLIPKAIKWKSRWLLEFACNIRAKQTIKQRRSGKV